VLLVADRPRAGAPAGLDRVLAADLAQRVPDLYQILRVLHHRVYRLVRPGDLTQEGIRLPPLDALYRRIQLGPGEGLAGR